MSDDQERRISESERLIEKLFGVTTSAGERLAVLEASHMRTAADLQASREEFKTSLKEMQIAFEKSFQLKQEEQHKRTTIRLGVLTFLAAIVVPFATVAFQWLFTNV